MAKSHTDKLRLMQVIPAVAFIHFMGEGKKSFSYLEYETVLLHQPIQVTASYGSGINVKVSHETVINNGISDSKAKCMVIGCYWSVLDSLQSSPKHSQRHLKVIARVKIVN